MKNLRITVQDGVELTPDIKKYIEKKMSKFDRLLSKTADTNDCNYRIGKASNSKNSGDIYYAEARISTSKKNYGARAEDEDLRVAIDELKNELVKKVTNHKDKKITLMKKGAVKAKDLIRKFKG